MLLFCFARSADCVLASDIPTTEKILLLHMLPSEHRHTVKPNNRITKAHTAGKFVDERHKEVFEEEEKIRLLLARDDIRQSPPPEVHLRWKEHPFLTKDVEQRVLKLKITPSSRHRWNSHPTVPPGDMLLTANRTKMLGMEFCENAIPMVVGKATFLENFEYMTCKWLFSGVPSCCCCTCCLRFVLGLTPPFAWQAVLFET